uniref:Uncharacterized protein n=1 Tax=Arundo donax TaxID=35708 RepID=A0A0A9F786_ARUDO
MEMRRMQYFEVNIKSSLMKQSPVHLGLNAQCYNMNMLIFELNGFLEVRVEENNTVNFFDAKTTIQL